MTMNGAGDGVAQALDRSVQVQPRYDDPPRSGLVLQLATVADDMPAWGASVMTRDRRLREFWPTEPVLASAVYSIVGRNAAFSWTLDGPPRTVAVTQAILHEADGGNGWLSFSGKLATDLLTQDNGAFMEVVRSGQGAADPVIGLEHLDAGRCIRTGRRDFPVIYYDREGGQHRLAPHQVIMWSEFPSPVETMNGVQLCAVSRVLRAAQLLRDISILQREKAAGRNPAAIHLVSGITSKTISDAMEQHKGRADQQGLARFILPLVLGSLDPTATISHEEIPLASLPDGFDLDVTMRWYINQLALGFGADYQDFAPLPGRGIGSGSEALVLNMKSRGKGPALFQKGLAHKLNFHGVLPRSVTFRFDEQDSAADLEAANLNEARAKTRSLDIASGVLTPQAARQQMVDAGELSQELFDALQAGPDLTDNITATDDERATSPDRTATPDGALGTPATATGAVPVIPAAAVKANEGEEAVSDYAEDERLEWEADYAGELERALAASFRDLRRRITGAASKGRRLFGVLPAFGVARKDEDDDALARRIEEGVFDEDFWAEFRVRMVAEALPTYRVVALGAAQHAADLGLAVSMDLVNEQVLEYSRTYVNAWWEEIDAATRKGLRQAIVSWQETGLGQRGLPDLVDAIEPLFGRMRAERIAVTEVTNIFADGSLMAYRSAGIEMVEFQTARDSYVCTVCGPLNGKRYALNDAPKPAMHVNCRCALLPVANDQTIKAAA